MSNMPVYFWSPTYVHMNSTIDKQSLRVSASSIFGSDDIFAVSSFEFQLWKAAQISRAYFNQQVSLPQTC